MARVLDEAAAHFVSKAAPTGDEGCGVVAIAGPEFVVNDNGKDIVKLGETAGAGQLGDGFAELAARSVVSRHPAELFFELADVHSHYGWRLPSSRRLRR